MPPPRNEGARFALQLAIATRLQRIVGRGRRMLRLPVEPGLIEQYELMKLDNSRAPSLYQASEFLAVINSRILDYIFAGAQRNIRLLWSTPPTERRIYRALLRLYYTQLQIIDTEGFLQRFEEPGTGGVRYQEIIDGRAMGLDFLQSVEEAYNIRRAWQLAGRSGTPRLIVDLGAGYGRLAYVIRKMLPDSTYVVLDLPEALACAYSWLTAVLPKGEVMPYNEARTLGNYTRSTLSRAPVWTLGAQALEKLEEADVFVCLYNLAVMSEESIANYFTHIDRTATVLYSKCERKAIEPASTAEASGVAYPFRPHWKQLFLRTASLYDDWVELAYRIHE